MKFKLLAQDGKARVGELETFYGKVETPVFMPVGTLASVKGITKQMIDFAFKGGHGGMINEAISALDIALWDLKAKSNNEPLWKTLGGLTPKARAYASGLDIPMNDKNLKEWYEKMASWGFDGGKLKVGLNQDDDIRRIGIMRDALKVNTENPLISY